MRSIEGAGDNTKGVEGSSKQATEEQTLRKKEHFSSIMGAPFLRMYFWLYTIYRFNKTKVSRTVRDIRMLLVCLDATYKRV